MDLVVAGIEIAALVAPTVGALLVIARQRALGDAAHRAELAALRVAIVGEILAPVAFASGAANGADIEPVSWEQTRTRRVASRTMQDDVADILAGRYTAAGVAAPMTTAEQREALASCLPDGFRDARASARDVGLEPRRAELPEVSPFQLLASRGVVLYRPGANEEAWILGGVATRLLVRSGLAWNEADVWLLARDLAGGFSLLDVAVASRNVSA